MQHEDHGPHCGPQKNIDFVLWGSLFAIILGFIVYFADFSGPLWLQQGAETVVDLMAKMAWGLIFALLFVGFLDLVPREKLNQLLGRNGGVKGVVRATLAGVLLDLCSHGILLVAMKLYHRGVSLGQVMAFLIASPWNSLSMTLILWSLIGFKLTLAFILLSCVVAILTGLVFESLVKRKVLPENPNSQGEPATGEKVPWIQWDSNQSTGEQLVGIGKTSLHESKMILRWIFFGVLLTAVVKQLLTPDQFTTYFGPDFTGVLLTLGAATVLEVCSEGSAPLAAELVTTAHAPGNAFTFLMTGVSTDYTEIMALKETTRSWKIAFFLPLVSLPQVVLLGWLINIWSPS